MNLLIVNDTGLIGGGAESRIRILLNCLAKDKFLGVAHILCSEEFNRPNLKLKIDFPVKYYFCKNRYLSCYKTAISVIKNNKINLVSVHNAPLISPTAILAAKKIMVPVIWFAHDYWPLCAFRTFFPTKGRFENHLCDSGGTIKCAICSGYRSSLRLGIFRKLLNKADAAIAPSNFVKEIFEKNGVLIEKWEVISPWINTDIYSFCNQPERQTLLFVGPLAVYKGIDVALEAMAWAEKQLPDIEMIIVGPEQETGHPNRKRINQLACKLGIYDRLTFAGYKQPEELKDYYAKVAVYLCPPLWPELFGLNWAEALACGARVIASNSGSIPEISQGKIEIVKNGSAEELAHKIVDILRDKNEGIEQKKKLSGFADKQFDVKRAAEQFKQIYIKLSR